MSSSFGFAFRRPQSIAFGGVGAQPVAMAAHGIGRLPTDPVGVTAVTFDGVNAGSEIRVYLPNGTEAAGVENCDDDHLLSWNAYAEGSANNVVTIRVVHPSYKIKEFTFTTRLGTQVLPVQQELDPWYSNP